MKTSILVTYATSCGSTQEVAQSIVETLGDCGMETDIQPAKKVKAITNYNAVILGAPLYMSRWHSDVLHFLARQRSVLTTIPMAIFTLGPFHNKQEELSSAREQLDKALVKFSWLKPVSVEVFVGKFDPAALRFPYNLILPLKKMPPIDERDWEAIRAWTECISERLKVKEK
jgi:menaquinone-dependent protoporphyrinogen oxidase